MQALPDELRDVDVRGTGANAGRVKAVKTTRGFDQHFVRRQQGMERLKEMGRYFPQQTAQLAARMESLLQVQARLNEIDALKKEIQKLELAAGHIFRDQEKVRARDAVQKRVDALLAELERTAEDIHEEPGLKKTVAT